MNFGTNLFACSLNAGAAGDGVSVLTNGASGVYILFEDEIDGVVDPGGWYDSDRHEVVLPADGTYQMQFWCSSCGCHARPIATNSANAGWFQIGSGDWGTPLAGNNSSMCGWNVVQSFPSGTVFRVGVTPDRALSATNRIDWAQWRFFLVGPPQEAFE